PDGTRQLVACVVAVAGAKRETPRLAAALGERLPPYMVPTAFVWRDALPLNPSGKFDRLALAAELRTELASRAPEPEARPRTPIEEVLSGLWTSLLQRPGVGGVGLHDDFFALGGHSLLATQLKSRIRQAIGADLEIADLFDHSTLERQAAAVEAALAMERPGGAPLHLEAVPHADGAPLSYAQERMWFLDRLRPGETTYSMPVALRLSGALDGGALTAAVAALVERHETLRTAFVELDGQPWQRILAAGGAPSPFAAIDLSALPPPRAETLCRQQLRRELERPFDLTSGAPLRVRLWRLAPAEHVLFVSLHHIVSDGWSMGILVRELAAFYEARGVGVTGRTASLPPLPVQYADYAICQRRWLDGPELAAQVAYWREVLAGVPPLDLPLDDPAAADSQGATWSQRLPADLSAAVQGLAGAGAASLFMVLAAAFQVLLHRLTAQEDVALGYPIAGRGQQATEGLIGVFLNTLVLRTRIVPDERFRDLLARVRQSALDAYANQDVPFEKLLEDLQPERDLHRTPFFNVLLNVLTFAPRPAAFGGVQAAEIPLGDTTAKLDLTLYASDTGRRLAIDWTYRTGRLSEARVAALADSFAALLGQLAENPDAVVAELSLLSREAREQVLPDPRQLLPLCWEGPVHQRFMAAAGRFPERRAVADARGTWTYAQLERESARLARGLAERGIGPGAVVAVHADRSAGLVWALLGILRAGAAFAILDSRHPDAHLTRQARLAAPRAWIRLAGAPVPGAELAAVLAELPRRARLVLPAAPGTVPEELRDVPAEAPAVDLGPHDLAYLAFTSGSTGLPRCIAGPHAPLAHFVDWHAAASGFGPDDRFSLLSGLAHDPLLRDVFTPLAVGASVEVPGEEILREPPALRAWLRERRVTAAHLTPALAQLLALGLDDGSAEEPADTLRAVFTSGEQLRESDITRLGWFLPHVRWVNFYGATETPQGISWQPVAMPAAGRARDLPVPIGRGIEGVQLLVLQAAGGLAGIGEIGEISVRSPYLATGYAGDPAATAERFAPNPLSLTPGERIYRTGDLGRYEPDGAVRFAGRRDQQVKIRGYRVELREVEGLLQRHPAVARAVVVVSGGETGA
ncbi:MAG TPA: amino acid adenylation domain-containing protein, partial [Thermoanaerobaculia bacterium]|nr:amino acid adenylation domain-containing protein [Thermoanaerobaculia bacterium]